MTTVIVAMCYVVGVPSPKLSANTLQALSLQPSMCMSVERLFLGLDMQSQSKFLVTRTCCTARRQRPGGVDHSFEATTTPQQVLSLAHPADLPVHQEHSCLLCSCFTGGSAG